MSFAGPLSMDDSFQRVNDLSNLVGTAIHTYFSKKCISKVEQGEYLNVVLEYNHLHREWIEEDIGLSEFLKCRRDLESSYPNFIDSIGECYPISAVRTGTKIKKLDQHLFADASDGYPKEKLFHHFIDSVDLTIRNYLREFNLQLSADKRIVDETISKESVPQQEPNAIDTKQALTEDKSSMLGLLNKKIDSLSGLLTREVEKDEPLTYSLKEVAERIGGISSDTLRSYANEGKINAIKNDPNNPRSNWRVSRKEYKRIEKYIKSGKWT